MLIFRLIILGVIILYFQGIGAPYLKLGVAEPNFLLAYAIIVGVRLPISRGIPLLFTVGLGYDLLFPQLLGLNTILLMLISLLIRYYHPNINKGKFISILLSSLLINFIYYFLHFLYQLLGAVTFHQLVWHSFISILYNTVITLVLLVIWAISLRIKISLDV